MSAVALITPTAAAHSAGEVHRRLLEALCELRDAERNAVLWFAEVLRRRLYRDLGYGTIHQYAADALGFSPVRTSQFIRLASSLEELPELKRAVTAGEIPWTTAREVARVATPETESRWIATAKGESRRALEARIRALRGEARLNRGRGHTQAALPLAQGPGAPEGGGGVDSTPGAPSMPVPAPTDRPEIEAAELPVHHQLRFTPAQEARWAGLLERLRKLRRRESREELVLAGLEALARDSDGSMPDAAAVPSAAAGRRPGAGGPCPGSGPGCGSGPGAEPTAEAAPGDADSGSPRREARDGTARSFPRGNSRPTHRVVLLHCPRCGSTESPSRNGGRPVALSELRAALCDGEVVQRSGRVRTAIPPRLRAAALARDRHRCRTPGCGGTAFLEVHHVVSRERGGKNELDNLITLCSGCHRALHVRG